MAASPKAINNANRLRYIRSLERFHKGMVSFLMNTPTLTHKSFDKKIENSLKLLNRVEAVDLYKGELKDLQLLVQKMISYKESQEDIEEIKDTLLYASNQLEKNKNARRYKKDKHVNSKFDEWE